MQVAGQARVAFPAEDAMDVRPAVPDLACAGHLERLRVFGQDIALGVIFRHVTYAAAVNCDDKRGYRAVSHAPDSKLICDDFDDFLARLDRDHEHSGTLLGGRAVSHTVSGSALESTLPMARRFSRQGSLLKV